VVGAEAGQSGVGGAGTGYRKAADTGIGSDDRSGIGAGGGDTSSTGTEVIDTSGAGAGNSDWSNTGTGSRTTNGTGARRSRTVDDAGSEAAETAALGPETMRRGDDGL